MRTDGNRRPIRLKLMTTLSRAKRMRKDPTSAENRLWQALRNRKLAGFKFVRQAVVGPYILDFLCREFGVAVEVDGPSHATDGGIARDARRTVFLRSRGLVVYRISNPDVHCRLAQALDGIALVLLERERASSTAHSRGPPSPSAMEKEGYWKTYLLHNVEKGDRAAGGVDEE
jgi:very-short-patch-repair endonuclease